MLSLTDWGFMAKLTLKQPAPDAELKPLIESLKRRVSTTPPGVCPLALQLALLETSALQTCGKCTPCSEGLPRLARLLRQIVQCEADEATLASLKRTAQMVQDTSDCAIGYEAAARVIEGLGLYADEYQSHLAQHRCSLDVGQTLPCESGCPAHVDIPAYIAFTGQGDYESAIKVIRQDNPFPTACAYICEYPCEAYCRRALIDSPLNIRGIKRFVVEQTTADTVACPPALPATGKRIAVIGGGPSGLTCAYYLALMGHAVHIFEQHKQLGGMLRYGIPAYRLPRERLDQDIKAILSAGNIEVSLQTEVDAEQLQKLLDTYDAAYLSLGAQSGKALSIEGAEAEGVLSAVELLEELGDTTDLDFTGKKVAVIGGGNVAMDCARIAIRAGADEVSLVYRRRKEDMTALPSEVESAMAEGVELITLEAPVAIKTDEQGHCTALITQPQMIGTVRDGRPTPMNANKPQVSLDADLILVAIGQAVGAEDFADCGVQSPHGLIESNNYLEVEGQSRLFTGGDCNTGPATVVRAIAAGKIAARNIDESLGYHHSLDYSCTAPEPHSNIRTPLGRVEIAERPARQRKQDYEQVEESMSLEEAMQECSRCLRCDHYGSGVVEGGRVLHD